MSRHSHHEVHGWHLHPQLADDTHPLAQFALCELRLMDDANHPWLILVPRIENAIELIDLDPAQQTQLMQEIDRASRALQAAVKPHKLNVAALGNMVPQLHVHVIARFQDDIAWPRPVWGTASAQSYSPELLIARVEVLRAVLEAH
ncbi:MAG: HIT domain-containing protein [Lysobacteraceae bacterium]